MKIGILGTRGIPNHYGGFEQFAEYFATFLITKNHEVCVYNSSNHPYKQHKFKGVNIIHCHDPQNKIGTVGQFIYDLNCILDSRKRIFDIILQLGYTSNTIWHRLLPKDSVIITNMDGMEWRRSKYSTLEKRFLKYAEKLAVKSSDYLISDSLGIQKYLRNIYEVESKYIAYGAEPFSNPDTQVLEYYSVELEKYNLLIARFEPENSLEIILDGVEMAENKTPFLVIGNHDSNKFGSYLKNKYKNSNHIKFIGGVYDMEHLNNLRYFSNLYFHGHSVGGTNPSLLEAMASHTLIIAHDNEFNKSILEDDAFYFSSKQDVRDCIENKRKAEHRDRTENCVKKIHQRFTWDLINNMYLDFFNECLKRRSNNL
ncbi:Glycosyltransferase involved in cell wall bisynthesis [Flavobacteriaceae bacterium MAR_2010_188]|nr:Glycosyltransferase involved in cell wall bisynthesis [Flavobacteriaceae bacterium MAR_2010_188]